MRPCETTNNIYPATGIIWVECQVSLGANKAIMAKVHFEEWLWETAAAKISHLHSDNRFFTADMFCADCKNEELVSKFLGCWGQSSKCYS
jgi:hypothetical protein